MRRMRGGDAGDAGEDDQDDQGEASPARSGLGPEVLTRLATWALWALVALGAAGGTLALLTRPTVVAASAHPPTQPSDGPGGFAELYVAAYLGAGEGTEGQLLAFYPERVELRGVQAGALYSARTVTTEVEVVGEGYWSVTVAADVLVAEGEEFRRGGTRFFRVGIVQGGRGLPFAATSLPGEIPEPPAAPEVRLDLGSMERPKSDDPVAGALGRFFAAYLAGDGELARYVAPGAPLRAVLPAPFASTEVTRLATKELGGPAPARAVLVEVHGTDAGGRLQVLHYSLALSLRAERWEVTALLPGPPLRTRPPPAPTAGPGPPPAPVADATASSTSIPTGPAAPAGPQSPTTSTERTPG